LTNLFSISLATFRIYLNLKQSEPHTTKIKLKTYELQHRQMTVCYKVLTITKTDYVVY